MRLLLLIFIFYSLFASCRKEVDEIPPQIEILSPSGNSNYKVLDDVFLEATIQDDLWIERVKVTLISYESNQKVLSELNFSPQKKTFSLKTTFSIADSLLAGGNYYFKIEAMDKENTSNAFRDIRILGLPKVKLGLIVGCSNESESQFYQDQNDFNFSLFHSTSTPLLTADLNSIDQYYWFVPSRGNTISAFHLKNNVVEFEKTVLSGFSQQFTDLTLFDRTAYIGGRNGEILAFDERFQDNYTYRSEMGRSILTLGANQKYVLAEEADYTSNNRRLQITYRNSGFLRASVQLNNPVKAICFTETERAILFQNNLNGGLLSEVELLGNTRRTMKTFSDSILSVEQINAEEFLVSTPNKVMKYDYSRNTLLDYLMIPAAILSYDDLNNQLYVGEGLNLRVYNYGKQSPLSTTTLSLPIKSIDVRYNR